MSVKAVNNSTETVAERFVKLVVKQLKSKQLSREELAKKAGVGLPYLYRVLNSEQVPTIGWAKKVMSVLEISIDFELVDQSLSISQPTKNVLISETELKERISENLKRILGSYGWSQGELARRMFGEDSTSKRMIVSRLVRGERAPSSIELINLSEILGVSVETLAQKKILKKIKK